MGFCVWVFVGFFFFKQKTAYELRISDWSSDVCSSDLVALKHEITYRKPAFLEDQIVATVMLEKVQRESAFYETVIKRGEEVLAEVKSRWCCLDANTLRPARLARDVVDRFFRSEEHTSELQSLMRISYAVFCLKKKKNHTHEYIIKS